jgi:chlorite dismutase
MAEPPQTDEGWFALHDFRTVDWDAWRAAPEHDRERAVAEGVEYLRRHEDLADADEGCSAVFSVLGHKADLMVVHFRPTLDALSTAERALDRTALGAFTEQTTSYVSVTEVSGYGSTDYFDDPESVDEGYRRYVEGKLHPDIPEDTYVSFYPMSKRRDPEYNWYDLDFEERAEMMATHGETGKGYAGKIKQVIASSVGFDDFEWGVTLFSDDPTHIKDIVYEMRFDEVSAKYGEFGQFYVGRRFPPADLGAFLAGETVPTDDAASDHPHGESAHGDHPHGGDGGHGDHPHGEESDHAGGASHHPHADESSDEGSHGDHPHGEAADESGGDDDDGDIRGELADLDIYAGKPHGEDVYATVLYSEAPADELFEEVDGLRANFDHYPTHVKTAVYDAQDGSRRAVVSIWETASAADTAAGFLSELPDIVSRAGEESGFGTMGMFYTVKPDYREEFVEKFGVVGAKLDEIEGHQGTDLMVNHEDDTDMFISSQWDAREDAMGFFRSDDFRNTVQWGRDVLADRPRHVFLA